MENRYRLPLPILAEIEIAKDQIYQDTKRFSLLFLPARNPLAIFAEEFDFSKQTTAPRQRMPAALHVQIEDFTESLFRIEARHYVNLANDAEQLRSWLSTLASDIRKLAVRQVTDKRLDFHLSPAQRLSIIETTLNGMVEQWSVLKISGPKPQQAPVAITEFDIIELPRLKTAHAEQVKPIEEIGDQIERLRLECDLSIEGLAAKVGVDTSNVSRHIRKLAIPSMRVRKEYEQFFSKALNRKVLLNRSQPHATKRNRTQSSARKRS